jgi:hypothetical protein
MIGCCIVPSTSRSSVYCSVHMRIPAVLWEISQGRLQKSIFHQVFPQPILEYRVMHKQNWLEVGGLLDVWLLYVGSCQTVVYTTRASALLVQHPHASGRILLCNLVQCFPRSRDGTDIRAIQIHTPKHHANHATNMYKKT